MENGSLSASDVALLSGNNGFGFGGDGGAFMWIFALLILANGGFGGGWGNNGNTNAIQADVNRGFDNQNLQAQTRDILSAVTNGTAQTIAASTANATNAINAIKDGNASLIREFGTVETALTALSGNMKNCCCDVKQLIQATSANTDAQIARNNYDAAMRDAATNANFTAQIQSVKDMIAQDKIESLQAQVSQLQLQSATANVLRYPNAWTYNGGFFPPMQCGCNGNI